MDPEIFAESWLLIKQYISQKEKVHAAYHLVAQLQEWGVGDEYFIELRSADKHMKVAIDEAEIIDDMEEYFDDDEY